MIISNLNLTNFRNFTFRKIVFDPKLTVIIGPNGSGKSNILEAIGLLSAVRLRRVDTDLDLVKFGKSEAKIEGKVGDSEKVVLTLNLLIDDPEYSSSTSMSLRAERSNLSVNSSEKSNTDSSRFTRTISDRIYKPYVKKSYFIDEIRKRWVDFTNHLAVVEFSPSDLELISGSPSVRRHHLDSLLSSLDRDYWRAITNYNKVIVRRNKVLQRIGVGKVLPAGRQAKKSELDFWDERLLEHGKYLTEARQKFFEFVNLPAGRQVLSLSNYSWELKQSVLTGEKLANNRDRDIAAGMTLSGPHRDDFIFNFHKKNLEFFGSRGEQRMAVLALKLVELEYFASKRGSRPILALDDIFSELDWEHREAVLGVIDKQQTIITAAEEESLPKEVFKKVKVVELR